MFDLVRNNKRLVQVVLALITLPFAFWGIESYQRSSGTAQDLAEVAGQKITMQEFTQAQRDQQERLRSLLGRNFDPALLDTPEQRAELLAQLRRSDLTQRAFVKNHGLSLATLGKWLRRDPQKGTGISKRRRSPHFQAVNLGLLLGGASWAAEVALADGVILRLGAHVNSRWASELLQALRWPC